MRLSTVVLQTLSMLIHLHKSAYIEIPDSLSEQWSSWKQCNILLAFMWIPVNKSHPSKHPCRLIISLQDYVYCDTTTTVQGTPPEWIVGYLKLICLAMIIMRMRKNILTALVLTNLWNQSKIKLNKYYKHFCYFPFYLFSFLHMMCLHKEYTYCNVQAID